MKPKSFNRDMKRELAGTLAAHGVAAVIACAAAAGAWDYARWWTLSLISGLSVLLRLPTADPGPEPTYVFRGPLEAAADAAASGQAGELLAALALVAASVLALGFVSWGRSWARLHDGTFAGDRAPTRTHGDAWLESRPSRVARRCPPWDGKAAAEGLVAAGCIGGGIAMVPAVHCLIRAGSGAGKSRRALAPSIAAAIDRNAHGIPTSVIVHDPKSEIRAWTEPLARRTGMEVVAIRLDEPVKSARFNPLDRAIAALGTEGTAGAVAELRELSSAIVPDAFSSGQRFFTDASRNLLTGLCLLAITDDRIPDGARNLSTVLALLEPRDGKSAVKSLEELATDLPAGNPARQFLLVASSNGGGGEALVSTARNYLMSFCDDDVSRMLWGGEVDLASVGRKPTILYIASATDRGDRGALVSCIFSQALSALRETARLSGGRLPAETLLAIDEGSGIPKIPRLLGDLAEVRSIGLHVVFVLQNTHLLEARCGYSRAESDALLALLGTQVVLSVESVGEAEEISKRLGDYSVRTTGESSTKGTQSSSSGKSFSVARRPLITPSELMAWSARENGALVIDAGGPMALASRDITETFLGPLLGMTSPEAEGALLARALEGEVRNDAPAPVWRIPEKPKKPKSTNASMGIYCCTWSVLRDALMFDEDDPNSANDFGKNIIPMLLTSGHKLMAYPFDGYWKDVGTIDSLWEANMELLGKEPAFQLRGNKRSTIYARNSALPSSYIDTKAVISDSFVAEGCEVYGKVKHSVISVGCTIGEGAQIEDAVVMPGVVIEAGAIVRNAILGENSRVCRNAVVGGAFAPNEKKRISVTSKGAVVEANAVLRPGDML